MSLPGAARQLGCVVWLWVPHRAALVRDDGEGECADVV